MKPTLTALWYGQLSPADPFCADRSQQKKFHELNRDITQDLDTLHAALPKETRKILDHCIETMYECQEMSETNAFINGFSLGVNIITEAEAEY